MPFPAQSRGCSSPGRRSRAGARLGDPSQTRPIEVEDLPTIQFTLNGSTRSFESREGETLLETLRDRFGIRSTKNGCAPQGQCGACLALIDGKAKTTCAVPVEKADAKQILTLEGIPQEERRLIARCFTASAGLQCGFCIPGIAMRAYWLVERQPSPTRAEVVKALDAHLCRCTGYIKIFEAIELYAAVKRGEAQVEPSEDGRVGASLARWHGEELTLGLHEYTDDMSRPGMLHGAVVMSAHPRARVKAIDTATAETAPGVVRVLRGK